MVNITKRMHGLMPQLWSVASGNGAAILPPKPPAPQLTHLRLTIPNPCNGFDGGARVFWRDYLSSLRYHNLTLPIVVEQQKQEDAPVVPKITLRFESQDRSILDSLDGKPKTTDQEALQAAQQEMLNRKAENAGKSSKVPKQDTWVDALRKQQIDAGIPRGQGSSVGEVTTKPQASADSPTVYTRSITLGLRGRSPQDVWGWFSKITHARPYVRSKDDQRQVAKYKRFVKTKSEPDRQRVKAGMDAMRREKADLLKAREAADRLAAEA